MDNEVKSSLLRYNLRKRNEQPNYGEDSSPSPPSKKECAEENLVVDVDSTSSGSELIRLRVNISTFAEVVRDHEYARKSPGIFEKKIYESHFMAPVCSSELESTHNQGVPISENKQPQIKQQQQQQSLSVEQTLVIHPQTSTLQQTDGVQDPVVSTSSDSSFENYGNVDGEIELKILGHETAAGLKKKIAIKAEMLKKKAEMEAEIEAEMLKMKFKPKKIDIETKLEKKRLLSLAHKE